MSVEADVHFAIIPEWVLDGASGNAVKLYGILARYADKGGRCHPSRQMLSKRMDVSLGTVDRARQELMDVGAITVVERFADGGDQTSSEITVRRIPPSSQVSTPLLTGEDTPSSQVSTQEREPFEREQELTLLRGHFQDLWEACELHVRKAPSAKSPRSAYAKLVREMLAVGWTPELVATRADAYRRHPVLGNALLTLPALAKWGETLEEPDSAATKRQVLIAHLASVERSQYGAHS